MVALSALRNALFLWVFWLALTGSLSLVNLLVGFFVSLLVAILAQALLREQISSTRMTLRTLGRFFIYLFKLIAEIIKANVDVAARVLDPRMPIHPGIIEYKSLLTEDVPQTMLANSITLTPGTLTVDIQGQTYYIHCLALEHGEDLTQRTLENWITWVFKKEER